MQRHELEALMERRQASSRAATHSDVLLPEVATAHSEQFLPYPAVIWRLCQ
jgi:hypothetical protein